MTGAPAPVSIASGHPAIDRYLADGYARVRGMSSRFAAAICGHVVRRQAAQGIAGDLVEIGTFEGRFFIAMALGLAPGETALGIDVFNWPDAGLEARFLANCAAHGLARERFVSWKTSTRTLSARDLSAKLGGRPARFIHVDGDHDYASLSHDLTLAQAVLHPQGVICLDDMLHPGYPTLITAVLDYLKRESDMRVLCVIDREDIVAAAKFLVGRADTVDAYVTDLAAAFAPFRWGMAADMVTYPALVLTPHPRLAEV